MKIIKNENNLDRFIRLIISELLFIFAFFWLNSLSAMILYIVALIMLATSISGFCGLYTVFKINNFSGLIIRGDWGSRSLLQ